MNIISNPTGNLRLFSPAVHRDSRGFFYEKYNQELNLKLGFEFKFVQENESYSAQKGTIRGIHYQKPPFEQTKMLTVQRGSIFDVVVDLRQNSPDFGKYYTFNLNSEDKEILVVPRGFGHGFCTLENDTIVNYKVDSPYSKENEITIKWNDDFLGINWPEFESYQLSTKDSNALALKVQFLED